MTNFTQDPAFTALVAGTEQIIAILAGARVPDAKSLAARQAGWNNLQGHARGVIPLAVWFIRQHPHHLTRLRGSTRLRMSMSRHSSEAGNVALWQPIQSDLIQSLVMNGTDIISIGTSARSPRTAQDIANTYLSNLYGGAQTTGQAGNTVLKRTLKLLAHVLPQ